MPKKMYVIQADDGMFYCGMRYWDKQLRKAKIYHSLAYAEDVSKDYEECNCKIVEVSLAIVPEAKTNADRIRAMTDEELAKFLECFGLCHHCTEHHRLGDVRFYQDEKCDEQCEQHCLEWLKQPAEGE